METASQRLPRGIFYEATRGRWRVRLYKQGEVVHRSYHHDIESALNNWAAAKHTQRRLVRLQQAPLTDSLPNLLATLAFSFSPHFRLSETS